MKKIYKILGLLILILNFNQFTNAKPLPPGSGEGDVPANILILLDSSASMTARIGDGFPALTSVAIDWNGNRVFTNASKQDGGLYMVNSSGERINFSGKKDNGDTYERSIWWANDDTDRTCDNNINHRGRGTNYRVTENRMLHEVRYVTGVTVGGTNISNENLLFIGQYQPKNNRSSIIAVDDQYRCRLAMNIDGVNANGHRPRGFDISIDADGDIIVAAYGRDGNDAYQQTCNLNDGKCGKKTARGKNSTTQYGRLYDGARLRLNSDSTVMYVSDDNHVYGYQTTIVNGVPVIQQSSAFHFRKCSGSAGATGTQVRDIQNFDISSSDDDVMYVAGRNNTVQRVEWTSDTVCTATVTAGTPNSNSNRDETAGNLDAEDIRITDSVSALNIVGDRIIFSHSGHVDELTESRFTAANKDDAWQIAYGGTLDSRMDGAKKAIIAVLSDSSLTSGANFGFGHWNAGEKAYSKNRNPGGGGYCHRNNTRCQYYEGWKGIHPAGTSQVCSINSCLNVGISPEGANRAIQVVQTINTSFGTDSEAFSQIAHDYFFGPVSPHDPDSDCQLNYVIVIGDGMMSGTGTDSDGGIGETKDRLTRLRTDLGVKSLMVAYGPGIRDAGMTQFDELAVVGSCDAAGNQDCEATIVAKTPLELQTTLAQKIRQILAERLSFTAPSITATIQQGGSLYQAQFAYEQYGEWQGTILRKTLNSDGTVDHDENSPGNWDAAKRVKLQSAGGTADPGNADGRNIWTAIGSSDANYIGNWDNVNETNAPLLETEMEKLGYQINNYYTSSSTCTGDDTTTEERNGLLRFLAGQDFFDYDGDCITTELRDHVLGDIYHSQLIEVGAPDGDLKFTDNNQEAYFRATNNYQAFKNSYATRRDVLYAGSNSGLLHAFNAQTGDEEWAFLPPLLIGKLPTIINSSLDGRVNGKGGSNAIFGVDGSPVVHDVFMKGLTPEGNIEGAKSWHSILFVPFGRGGAGFSVLDVTNPIVKDGAGPLHMFTVYNDYINNKVYIADHEGSIREEEYSSGSANISRSVEAKKVTSNYNGLVQDDGGTDSTTFTYRDANAVCQTNAEVSGNFATNGTSSCYIGRTLTFNDLILNTPNNQAIDPNMLNVTEMVGGEFSPVTFSDARMLNGELVITFNEDKIFNIGQSSNEERTTNNIFVQTSCTAERGIDPAFDYSKLGETWSTPRIARLPSDIEGDSADPANDKYVAIMGGGMANNNLCAGSALFLVELNDLDEPGRIYGAEANGGPITIIDTSPEGVALGNDVIETLKGSDINNAIPTSPLVITPDTAFGIPWRGAMVYINDREGKITKINLTDSTVNDAELFDQTTLFRLDANTTNKRYTFFSMDAGVGVTTKDFWLFGGTGDFNQLGDKGQFMDNILYGIRDFDFPNFKHLNGVVVPSYNDESFTLIAHQGANNARSIDDGADVCSDVTGDTDGSSCPDSESAWVIHLDDQINNTHRKASAPPTLFKGQVYFPVYEPAPGSNRCNIGNAYICAADDECGTNNSHKLVKGSEANGKNCTFVREGVLSELVIFGDKLFANVAGPSDNENTLYSILALAGEVLSNKGGWRDVGF